MTKRRFSITATDDDAVPVIATYGKKEGPAKKTYLAMLACDGCNTEILGPNTVSPFCPCCTKEMRATSDDTLLQTKSDIEKMDEIAVCDECDTAIAMPKDVEASLHDNALYCPSCASPIHLKADDAETDDSEDSDSEDMSDTVDDEETDEGEGLFDNAAGEGGETATETTDDTSTAETPTDTETDDPASLTDSGDSQTDDTSTDEGSAAEEAKETPTEEAAEGDSGNSLQANLVKFLSGKSGSISVVPTPDQSKYYLFVDNYPVAVSSKENASENVQGMFGTDKFSTSWEAATGEGVTEDVLNDFGFQATTVSVPVDEAVKQTVEAAIETERAKYTNMTASARSRFERCVGIAAVGINKNVFREDNPVKLALVASMKNLRVRGAEGIVSDVFNKHGEGFLKNVILKATELMDKSDETLDELAETVDEAKYTEENKEPVVAVKATPVIPFPAKVEDKIEEDEVAVPTELAASDDDLSVKFARLANRFRSHAG